MEAQKKMRLSNLELLRIISMLIIISHHYVVNSGITSLFDFSNVNHNMIFLQFVGFGGKMAINVFVLISAYFICTQKVTWGRILKLVTALYLYKFIIGFIFVLAGYQSISVKEILHVLLAPVQTIGSEFVGSFLVFYMLVPFLNRLVPKLTQYQHKCLAILLIGVFSIAYTAFQAHNATRYVGWFIALYTVGSYIRLHPSNLTEKKMPASILGVFSLAIILFSIIAVDFWGAAQGFTYWTCMCIDSQKFFAFTLALSLFLLFKNTQIRDNKIINRLASSAFGVLLIHANSDAMRTWLWQHCLKVPEQYASTFLPLHWLISILGIYLVCAAIDMVRIDLLERPLFEYLKHKPSLNKECFFE